MVIFFVLQPWRCIIGILEFISIVIKRFKIFATIPENEGREDQLDTNQRAINHQRIFFMLLENN